MTELWKNIEEATKAVNAIRQGIDRVCKGTYGRITAQGFKWKYLD